MIALRRTRLSLLLLLAVPSLVGAQAKERPVLDRILLAEDARGSGPDGITPILDGTTSSDATTRRVAVRAMGRLQRAALVARLAPLLGDEQPRIRIEAANAVAQSVASVPTSGRGLDSARMAVREAREVLLGRLAIERDPAVVGVLSRSAGRLP